jgi:hypothetical protein
MLRADGVCESRHACGGKCAQELVEWPGWVEVGALLFERGAHSVFPGERGGYLDVHHFRPYRWRPAQLAAGIDPLRRV